MAWTYEQKKAQQKQRVSEGLCTRCGRAKQPSDKRRCAECATYQKAASKRCYNKAKVSGLCPSKCGRPSPPGRTLCRTCSAKNIARRAGTTIEALREIWSRQSGRCSYSGIFLDGDETYSVDHKTPSSRGGDSASANLELVTLWVNRAKSNLTPEEFMCSAAQILAKAPETRGAGITGRELIDYWSQTKEFPGGHAAWLGQYDATTGEPVYNWRGQTVPAKDILRIINPGLPAKRRTCEFRGCVRHLADDVPNPVNW